MSVSGNVLKKLGNVGRENILFYFFILCVLGTMHITNFNKIVEKLRTVCHVCGGKEIDH